MPPRSSPAEPIPSHLKPMLARLGDMPRGGGWGFEVKWDGVRTIAYWDGRALRLESRNLNDITPSYPELADLGAALGARPAVLDGEIVVFDERGAPSFDLLQRRIHVTPTGALVRAVPVTYVIFDLLYLDARTTIGLPYEQRRELLQRLDLNGPRWRTPNFPGVTGADLRAVTAEHGLEGVVAKRLESPYRPGQRSDDWLKIKNSRRQELVIGGWLPGRGRRAEQIGALLVGYHEDPPRAAGLRYAGRVGSGFDEAELELLDRELQRRRRDSSPFGPRGVQPPPEARFVEPELVAEIRFGGWTKDGILRHSVYLGLREDRPASDVIRESLDAGTATAPRGDRSDVLAAGRRSRRADRRAGLGRTGLPGAQGNEDPRRGGSRASDAEALEPGQGPLPADRVHEGEPDRLPRRGGPRPAPAPARPTADAQALSGRRRGRVLLREALSPPQARVGKDGVRLERAGRGPRSTTAWSTRCRR